MNNRKLGNSGLEVSPICFGGNIFGWTVDEQNSFELLDAFLDAGFNFIDTADVYSKWASGKQRRRIGNRARQMAEAARAIATRSSSRRR